MAAVRDGMAADGFENVFSGDHVVQDFSRDRERFRRFFFRGFPAAHVVDDLGAVGF